MTITSSEAVAGPAQPDGRRHVLETYTDHLGRVRAAGWWAAAGVAADSQLTARAAGLDALDTAAEIAQNVGSVLANGSLASPTFDYSTVAANLSALRDAYQTATQFQAIMIGDYLSARSNALLQTAFGMTNAQVNTLRTNKLTPAANAAATIRATTGA